MEALLRLIAALCCCTLFLDTLAAEVIVEGTAVIQHGDQGQARELAIRRAMSRATESQGAQISSLSVVRPGLVLESTQVRSTGYAAKSQVLKETISDNELTVTMKIAVSELVSDSTTCESGYIKKIVVLDFGFEFSDQILLSEKPIIKYKTAGELARVIRKNQRLQVAFEDMSFPYFSPSSAPEPFTQKPDDVNPFIKKADVHQAQYILTGVYRDFGISGKIDSNQTRRIEIEAFLHDGSNGALLERKRFISSATGAVILSGNPPFATPLFYQTDFGKIWGGMLEDIALWAEEKVSCLPFISRIVKTSGRQIFINSGADSGLSAGDALNFVAWRKAASGSVESVYMKNQSELHTVASLISVYPRFSVLELTDNPELIERFQSGDLLIFR